MGASLRSFTHPTQGILFNLSDGCVAALLHPSY